MRLRARAAIATTGSLDLQPGIGSTLREQLIQLRDPPFRIAPSGNEIERVVIGAELVTALGRHGHERLQVAKAVLRQHAVAVEVKQRRGGLLDCRRAIRSCAKMDAALSLVAQIQLGKCRLVTSRESSLGAALFLQMGERELDVLAGAQFVRRIVGT